MEQPEKNLCPAFNFCFWAKLMVAIPALPVIAWIAAAFFIDPMAKLLAAAGAVGLTLYLARWIDRLPMFSRYIRK